TKSKKPQSTLPVDIRCYNKKTGLSLRSAPGLWSASEVEADIKVQEPRRAVLSARASRLPEVRRRDIKVRVVELHVVEQVHGLDSETHLHPRGDGDALADGRIVVPARVAANGAVAGPLVSEQQLVEQARSSRRVTSECLAHRSSWTADSWVAGIVRRRGGGSAFEGKKGAATTRLVALPRLLATRAVEHVQRDAGSGHELAGERPAADDLVQNVAAASEVMSLAEGQVIDIEEVEGVPPIELRWTVVAMGIEVV